MPTDFRLMDVSRWVVDQVIAMCDRPRRGLLFDTQLRAAADSITANIREAYGRRAGPERQQFFRYALGSAEETDEHLRANFASGRIEPRQYWLLHNRLVVIMRMLTSLMQRCNQPLPETGARTPHTRRSSA
jgi:four helix bundle protein